MAHSSKSILISNVPVNVGISTAKEKLTNFFQQLFSHTVKVENVLPIDSPGGNDSEHSIYLIRFDSVEGANGALTDQKKKLISFGDEFTVQLEVSACPLEMEARYLETYATEEADDVSTCNVQTDSLPQTHHDNSNLPLKQGTLEPSLKVQSENKDSFSKI
ncbi:uncharacterized protein LOC144347832, partial [Saccoglossus kowalevskii]